MPAKLKPAKFRVEGCGDRCNCGPGVLGADRAKIIHGWFEEGLNNDEIAARAKAVDPEWGLSNGSLGRHRANHLRQLVDGEDDAPVEDLSDIEALRRFIQRGVSQMGKWRIDPGNWMKAVDMYYKMTQGSAMADFFSALSAAASGDNEDVDLSDPSLMSEDEADQGEPNPG